VTHHTSTHQHIAAMSSRFPQGAKLAPCSGESDENRNHQIFALHRIASHRITFGISNAQKKRINE
jgi:hypothetical protein